MGLQVARGRLGVKGDPEGPNNKWSWDHLFFWFSMALAAQCELKNADGIILASAGGSLASSVDRCLEVAKAQPPCAPPRMTSSTSLKIDGPCCDNMCGWDMPSIGGV